MGGDVKLAFFDLGKLVRKLNAVVDCEEEGTVGREQFEVKEPKKNPFIEVSDTWKNREAEVRGKYPLIRTTFGERTVDALLSCDSDFKIGYVFVDKGWLGRESQYGGTYEAIRVRLKEPLVLKQDDSVREALGLQEGDELPTEIPNCSVRLSVEDIAYSPTLKRKDNLHYGPITTSRTSLFGLYGLDLKNVLPTEWFIADGCTNLLDRVEAEKPTEYALEV
jgi:hypothetical protein